MSEETNVERGGAPRGLGMNLFLVTTGDYSDYRLRAVCSTREKAEAAKLLFDSSNDVLEFELDELPEHPPGTLPFFTWMTRDGTSSPAHRAIPFEGEGVSGQPCRNPDGGLYFNVWATDENHAIKITNEKRIQLLASGEWTENWDEWCARTRSKNEG